MGARRRDLTLIGLWQGLLFYAVAFVLACIAVPIIITVINGYVQMTLITAGVAACVLLAASVAVTVALAMVTQYLFVAKKSSAALLK